MVVGGLDVYSKRQAKGGSEERNPNIISPNVAGLSGWISDDGFPTSTDNVVWYRASATQFACAGDFTGRYIKNCKISYNDGATDYGLVASRSFTPAAPITSSVGSDVTANTITKTAHGLANGAAVIITGLTNTLGITAGTIYYVVGTAANTFQLALTVGGAAIDLTGSNDTGLTITGATIVTLYVTSDYSIADPGGDHHLSTPRHSYDDLPQGWPGHFNFSTTLTGITTAPTVRYQVSGRRCFLDYYPASNHVSTAAAHSVTGPIACVATTEGWAAGWGFDSANSSCVTLTRIVPGTAGISSYPVTSLVTGSLGSWQTTGSCSTRYSLNWETI